MTEDEKTYIRWYEGRTFMSGAIEYRLEGLKHGTILLKQIAPKPIYKYRTVETLTGALKKLKDGRWVLSD